MCTYCFITVPRLETYPSNLAATSVCLSSSSSMEWMSQLRFESMHLTWPLPHNLATLQRFPTHVHTLKLRASSFLGGRMAQYSMQLYDSMLPVSPICCYLHLNISACLPSFKLPVDVIYEVDRELATLERIDWKGRWYNCRFDKVYL